MSNEIKGTSSTRKGKEKMLATKGRNSCFKGISNNFGIVFSSKEQQIRYFSLCKCPLLSTKFLDDATLDTLGFRDDIGWLFERIGWSGLMNMKYPTYPRIVLEILSSITLDNVQCGGKLKF